VKDLLACAIIHHYDKWLPQHCYSLYGYKLSYSQVKTKNQSPIIDINNHLNQVLPVFDSLNKEFSLGFQSVDTSSDHFSSNTIFIISNISVKNILFTKAELFAIRYDISQSFQI